MIKEKYRTKNYWGEIRVKVNPKTKEKYIDILVGKKGKKLPHTHMGVNPDMSLLFVNSRNVLDSIRREIDSDKRGRGSDETIFYSQRKGKAKFSFKVDIVEKTQIVLRDIKFFEVCTENNKGV